MRRTRDAHPRIMGTSGAQHATGPNLSPRATSFTTACLARAAQLVRYVESDRSPVNWLPVRPSCCESAWGCTTRDGSGA